jgi:hypothetical protein
MLMVSFRAQRYNAPRVKDVVCDCADWVHCRIIVNTFSWNVDFHNKAGSFLTEWEIMRLSKMSTLTWLAKRAAHSRSNRMSRYRLLACKASSFLTNCTSGRDDNVYSSAYDSSAVWRYERRKPVARPVDTLSLSYVPWRRTEGKKEPAWLVGCLHFQSVMGWRSERLEK